MVSGVFSIPLDACETTTAASADGQDLGLRQYIGGAANALVRVAAESLLAERPRYNPCVLFGPAGVGKSFLLRGLAHRWRHEHGRSNVVLCSASDFARAYAHAVDTDSLSDFRSRYRSSALLAMDDLHELAGKTAAQSELSRTADSLCQQGGLLWVTSRQPLSDLREFSPALTSRLSLGLTLPLLPPDQEARRAILEQLARRRGAELSPGVLRTLLQATSGETLLLKTAPDLSRAVQQLFETARLQKRVIDEQLAERLIAGQSADSPLNVRTITSTVARHFQLPASRLKGPSRQREVVRARGVAIFLTRRLTKLSLEQLGSHFGGRDHTTVMHACRTTESLLETDPGLRQAVDELSRRLAAR